MTRTFLSAGPPLGPIPPRYSPWVHRFVSLIAGLYRRRVMGIAGVDSQEARQEIARVLNDPGKSCIVLFRHPSPDDPPLVWQVVDQALSRSGVAPIFLYGRDVPIWAGAVTAWLLPRMGAVSVFQDGLERSSMQLLFDRAREGIQPLVLAPEGQVSYFSGYRGPTQRGGAALAVEMSDHLSGEKEVCILTLGLHYTYPDRKNRRLNHLLDQLDHLIGAATLGGDAESDRMEEANSPAVRAWLLADRLLSLLERDLELPGAAANDPDRVPRILTAALDRAEGRLGLSPFPRGEPIKRLFRCRRRYWELLFPPTRLPGPLGTTIADLEATAASIAVRHLQVADVLLYLDTTRLQQLINADLSVRGNHTHLVEQVILLLDLAGRAGGGTIAGRYQWPGRTVGITAGEPLAVAPRGTGTSRKAAITSVHRQINDSLDQLCRDPGM